jgi:hypothetical protein
MKPNEARAKLDLAPVPGVADELVSQAQVQPMQANADNAMDRNARENDLAQAQIASIEAKPTEAEAPKEEAEEEIKPQQKQIDMDALNLMLKGVFVTK